MRAKYTSLYLLQLGNLQAGPHGPEDLLSSIEASFADFPELETPGSLQVQRFH